MYCITLHCICLQFVQEPTLPVDTSDKECKPPDLTERQHFVEPTESCCNSAHRAKRMRAEVDALVVQSHTHLSEELLLKPVIQIAQLPCNHLLYSIPFKSLSHKMEELHKKANLNVICLKPYGCSQLFMNALAHFSLLHINFVRSLVVFTVVN